MISVDKTAILIGMFIAIVCYVCVLVLGSSGCSASAVASSSEFHTGQQRNTHRPSGIA